MEKRSLGPLRVSAVSLGAGHLGGELEDRDVFRLFDRALELGIDLIDTARSYGASEERIGRWLEGRRERVLVSTKVGYGVEGQADWTPSCIALGIDRALRSLRTDRIDIVHLHSCPIEILERPGIVDALEAAVRAGKVRAAAYSGDGAALERALDLGAFAVLQATINVCDRANAPILDRAKRAGVGTIAKRPLANAPWRFTARPDAPDLAEYFDRWRALALEGTGDPMALCLRFAAHRADTVLVGTRSPAHLEAAIAAVELGPLTHDISGWDPAWSAIT